MLSFIKTVLLALLVVVPTFAQTPADHTDPATYFVGVGSSYNRYATPPAASGWLSVGAKLSPGLYSITTLDMTSTSSSLRTGLAKLVKQSGNFSLFIHADGGFVSGSVTGGTGATLGSFSGGGMIMYDLSGVSKKLQHTYAVGVVRILSITSTSVQPVFEFGFGRSF